MKNIIFIILAVFVLGRALSAQALSNRSIYENYAIDGYTNEAVEEEKRRYYDLFGEHITDGYYVFQFENSRDYYYRSTPGQEDSIRGYINQYQDKRFYENLDNLVLSQDEVGGAKMLFMVGDHIHSRFSPLTMNKRNFKGLRWDMWSSGLKMTALFTRTRPGIMSRKGFGGNSYVSYPTLDFIPTLSWDESSDGEWLTNNSKVDWSQKTFFGDFDLFFGFHAENKIANLVNVGVTYLNHHHSDIEEGEKFFTGNLPSSLVPEEIHFEFSDLTSGDSTDAGVLLFDLAMHIAGKDTFGNKVVRTVAAPAHVYTTVRTIYERQGWIYPEDGSPRYRGVVERAPKFALYERLNSPALPCTANGESGIICTFHPLAQMNALGMDGDAIEKVDFSIRVAGNYQVFSSCEKLTAQDDQHFNATSTNLGGNGEIVLKQMEVDSVVIDKGIVGPSKYLDNKNSEVYFGNFIARTPVPVDGYANIRTISYTFTLPVSSVLYGFNFDGEIGGFSFNGEYATVHQESKVPYAAGERMMDEKHAAYLQLKYDFLKKYTAEADVYNIDGGYQPGLPSFQVSPYFSDREMEANLGKEPGYLAYLKVLDNGYTLIDDNEDDDYYTENDRKQYPAEKNFSNLGASFYNDGTMKGYAFDISNASNQIDQLQEKRVVLPTGMQKLYDDLDGVIRPIYDRNKNGVFDYEEDFLLYHVDLPVFSMELDLNNNTVYDVEEDDLLPDLPYQTGYVYTTNGIRTTGIRGLRYTLNGNPLSNLNVKAGGIMQQVLDPDIDGEEEDLEGRQGKHTEYFLRTMYDVNRRSIGLNFYAGGQVKRVWDGIRNDAVLTMPRRQAGELEIDYLMQTDNLRYFNALTTDVVGGVTYSNIANFSVTGKAAFGIEKHYQDENLYVTKAVPLTNVDGSRFNLYKDQYQVYGENTISSMHLMAKLDYTLKFPKQYRGRMAFMNVLQQLQIVPQYQLLYINESSQDDDPREIYTITQLAADTTASLILWHDYSAINQDILYSVPIVKAYFKIGEKTNLEYGIQWMRSYNYLVTEESFFKKTIAAQVVNRDVIQGYDVSTFFGVSIADLDYDINRLHPYLKYGSDLDDRAVNVFCKIYAGIKQ